MATFQGTSEADILLGTAEVDTLYGYADSDRLEGGDNNDSLFGGDGNDNLYGQYGNDTIYGENGNDNLYGYRGNDTLIGGLGNDLIVGAGLQYTSTTGPQSFGEGEIDTLTGGQGKDTFQLWGGGGRTGIRVHYNSKSAEDYALITDFNPSEDVIELTKNAGYGQLSAVKYSLGASPAGLPSGTGIYVENSTGTKEVIAVLQNVSPNSLSLDGSYFSYFS